MYLISAQESKAQICLNPKFDKKVEQTINHTVDIISPEDLSRIKDHTYIIDTREQVEYDVSHIPGAHFGGYNQFKIDTFANLPKDTIIVVYCSIGYRSEKIGEQLEKAGFTNVYNLYGSLFEWANQSYPLENKIGESTKQVHTYSKNWSKWVDEKKAIKIW